MLRCLRDSQRVERCEPAGSQHNCTQLPITSCFQACMFLPKSMEWFIEGQAFSPSSDLAPPSLPPSASCLSFSVFLCVAGRVRRSAIGEELNHTTARQRVLERRNVKVNAVLCTVFEERFSLCKCIQSSLTLFDTLNAHPKRNERQGSTYKFIFCDKDKSCLCGWEL